jgi:A/G-specific adenine glycosylase
VINQALLDWYRTERRDLPWRRTREPWQILVAEVMSQQTQLSRVVTAWHTFMSRFPEPSDLAEAEVADLIELWAGLGYHRRALNLRRAAAVIVQDGWPTTAEGLRELSGVGPYTAAAVACFAFGEPVPAVDTNLRRVLSRWSGEALSGRPLDDAARRSIDAANPESWNQAVMDLAATVCRPVDPRCGSCPVSRWCADPTIYVPPPRQSRYEGSVRQARAAIVKRLAASGPSSLHDLSGIAGFDTARLEQALDALVREGTVRRAGDSATLAG